MSSIFPQAGVYAASATNAYLQTVTPGEGDCLAQYYSSSCAQTLDVNAFNAMLSEMTSLVDLAGLPWNCSSLHNLYDAVWQIAHGAAPTFYSFD